MKLKLLYEACLYFNEYVYIIICFIEYFMYTQLQKDPEQHIQLKAQALIYPVLQALDLNTPSYQQNQHMPILPRSLMVRFWSEYFTSDKSFLRAMMANRHNNHESADLLKFVNWSSYLPDPYRQTYNYSAPPVDHRKRFSALYWSSLLACRSTSLAIAGARHSLAFTA